MKIVHQKHCKRGECGGVFKCGGCERWMGWCYGHGGDDPVVDMPELCDDCWLEVTEWRELLGAQAETVGSNG